MISRRWTGSEPNVQAIPRHVIAHRIIAIDASTRVRHFRPAVAFLGRLHRAPERVAVWRGGTLDRTIVRFNGRPSK